MYRFCRKVKSNEISISEIALRIIADYLIVKRRIRAGNTQVFDRFGCCVLVYKSISETKVCMGLVSKTAFIGV